MAGRGGRDRTARPLLDESGRKDGVFARADFVYDIASDTYRCPAGKTLPTTGTPTNGGTPLFYRPTVADCRGCPLKPRCCPNEPQREVPRSIFEGARNLAREIATTEAGARSRWQRKQVETLFAHLKRILGLGRLRLRGPTGARDEFLLAATAQNLSKLAKLIAMPRAAGSSSGRSGHSSVSPAPLSRRPHA